MRETQRTIDSAEFERWKAFDRIEPFGGARVDWILANIARTYFNAARDANSERYKTSDFMWCYQPRGGIVEQTDDQVAAAIDATFGALIKRQER